MLPDGVFGFFLCFVCAGFYGIACGIGHILGGVLHLIRSILFRRDLPIIHQVLRGILRADKRLFHVLRHDLAPIKCFDVMNGFLRLDVSRNDTPFPGRSC